MSDQIQLRHAMARSFALAVLHRLAVDLQDDHGGARLDLAPCGCELLSVLLSAVQRNARDYPQQLQHLMNTAHQTMCELRKDPKGALPWRRLYSEAALCWSLLDCVKATEYDAVPCRWEDVISRLDHALVIAGAPGKGRYELVLECIEKLQQTYLPFNQYPSCLTLSTPISAIATPIITACRQVPDLEQIPSVSTFRASLRDAPFVLRRFASEWPVVRERKWGSQEYLLRIAGRGRVVPVEVGRDYRLSDWTQRMMSWEDFLRYLFGDSFTLREKGADQSGKQLETIYLAQHSLFNQFPALRDDIIVPDYIYAALPPPDQCPQYRPPANEDELVLSAWFGPKGTISPAHTDPYYNLYVQVVGSKTVWLAAPHASQFLSSPSRQPKQELNLSDTSNALGNTTHLDVFTEQPMTADAIDDAEVRQFMNEVIPEAMWTTLEEGDMLFMPPGWWHAMRSESLSFSVSMWF